MNNKEYFDFWNKKYRKDLTEDIMPFWLKNGLDKENGGIYTCLDRNGKIIDTTKSVWFQGRFAFICAYAYNKVEKNKEWLDASKNVIDFIEKYCFDKDGRMFFEVSATGCPIRKRRYLFSESFAAIAMSEYSIASNDKSYALKALNLLKMILNCSKGDVSCPPKYCDSVEMIGHSLTMILINTCSRIMEAIEDPILEETINDSISTIQEKFLFPEFKALLENAGKNGEFIDSINGRIINPGHCIETSWFILNEAKKRNWDPQLKQLGLKILDWSWEWGWDKEFGGIINFRDCKNKPCQDYAHDMKFWWPQTEALIATLYAYQATGDDKYIEMFRKTSEWTYSHFPDSEYGEWYGYLHRDGTLSQNAKGNIFKGPFHIPRMMIKGIELTKEIAIAKLEEKKQTIVV
ncbi:MAG: AGE family epimerase/isomerase [Bacteroidales bacterium]|nr:AGE family epimerase/isomerase [Bacteroidales bacterium]